MIIKIRQVVAMLYSVSETTLMSEMLLLVMIYSTTSAAEAASIIPIARKGVAYVPSTELSTAANSTEFSDQVAVWPLKWYGSIMPL